MKNHMIFGCSALLLAALFLSFPASAQETKIGFVNLPRLLQQAPQASRIRQQLQDEFSPRERQILAEQQTLQGLAERLERDGALMGEQERRNLERDLGQGGRDLKRRQDEFLEDFNLRQNEELTNLQRTLIEQVQAYARAGNYDLIVGEPGILFVSDAIDVTDAVLAALEAAFQASDTGQ
ncbi:MAG: OmpH family outer membrane protein [Gammaproteobacteria bacterium]|nr:MAG: OmpH family outer membrane protein [Gammaproteobacteria bacterium]